MTKIDPGKGYRILDKNEILNHGDEYLAKEVNQWYKTNYAGKRVESIGFDGVYRRKIKTPSNLPTIGRIVLFYPKKECVDSGDTKIECYASIVTQVNPDDTLELATFGPNSLYFQHNVPQYGSDFEATSEHPAGKHNWGWDWPPRD